jgi:hypothetical protein
LERGEIGSAPLRSRRRDDGRGEAVSSVVSGLRTGSRVLDGLGWARRLLSDGMLWQPRADHEQKQELGDATITRGLDATRPITEALQLRSAFDVSVLCRGLMSAPPEGPCNDVSRANAALRETHCDAPDLLNRPADQLTL